MIINKINDQSLDTSDFSISKGSELKVGVTAYFYENLFGKAVKVPFTLRHMDFILNNGHDDTTILKTVLTNLLGKASVTFDTSNLAVDNYKLHVEYGSSYGYSGRCDIVIRSLNFDEQSGGTDSNDDPIKTQLLINQFLNETVSMKDTGTPINLLVMSVLAVIGGLVYTKK